LFPHSISWALTSSAWAVPLSAKKIKAHVKVKVFMIPSLRAGDAITLEQVTLITGGPALRPAESGTMD